MGCNYSGRCLISLFVCAVVLQHEPSESFSFTKTRILRRVYGQCRTHTFKQPRSFFTNNINRSERRNIFGEFILSMNFNANVEDGDDIILDAIIKREDDSLDKGGIVLGPESLQVVQQNALSNAIRKIAALSLEDYKWRSAVFKNNEAERKMEESLARISGEEAFYVRPMHATDDKLGPLGIAEKQAVEWLSRVIEEEGIRAKNIAEGDGKFIRPMDDNGRDGPLSQLERNVVNFFQKIVDSETERAINGKIRPMELDESKRGPLGEAEARAVSALQELTQAELLRAEQQQARGGDLVRPIDVPGPLGEFERAALEIWAAEQQRVKDKDERGLLLVRPKDASIEGPLGKAEREAMEAIDRLKVEENERAKSIRRLMEKLRPMDNDRESPLGFVEALTVGILRGPKLLFSVYQRVVELIRSEELKLDLKLDKDEDKAALNVYDDDDIGPK